MDLPEGWEQPQRRDGDGPWLCSRAGCEELAVRQVPFLVDEQTEVPVMACDEHDEELEQVAPVRP